MENNMSAGEHDIGSTEWYAVQFGPQKSYREMLFGQPEYAEFYYDGNTYPQDLLDPLDR
jgi:hypothetical protein